MRKILPILLFLMVLAGCGAQKTFRPVTRGLEYTAEVTVGGQNYTCDCNITQSGDMTVKICEPEELSGLSYRFINETVHAEYKGLSHTIRPEALPPDAVPQTLFDLTKITGTVNLVKSNGVLHTKIGSADVAFSFAPTGLPLSAQIPERDFTVSYRGVRLIP